MYNAYFLECAKSPTHKWSLSEPSIRYREENRHCGEAITIDLSIRDSRVDAIRFNGDLSIVTTGSAEILCENITDMTIDEIFAMTGDDILAMTEIEVTNRRKLALILPLLSLRNALHIYLCDGIKDDFGTLLEL